MSVTGDTPKCPACNGPVITDDSERTVYTEVGPMHRGCYDAAVSAGDAPRTDDELEYEAEYGTLDDRAPLEDTPVSDDEEANAARRLLNRGDSHDGLPFK